MSTKQAWEINCRNCPTQSGRSQRIRVTVGQLASSSANSSIRCKNCQTTYPIPSATKSLAQILIALNDLQTAVSNWNIIRNTDIDWKLNGQIEKLKFNAQLPGFVDSLEFCPGLVNDIVQVIGEIQGQLDRSGHKFDVFRRLSELAKSLLETLEAARRQRHV